MTPFASAARGYLITVGACMAVHFTLIWIFPRTNPLLLMVLAMGLVAFAATIIEHLLAKRN